MYNQGKKNKTELSFEFSQVEKQLKRINQQIKQFENLSKSINLQQDLPKLNLNNYTKQSTQVFNNINNFSKVKNILQEYRNFTQLQNNFQLSIEANNYATEVIKNIQSKANLTFDEQETLNDLIKLSLSHSNLIKFWGKKLNQNSELMYILNISLDLIKTLELFKVDLKQIISEDVINLIEKDNEIVDDVLFETILEAVKDDLIILWKGVVFAISSYKNNPDYMRHCAVSLRELLLKIIDFYAPNENVESWTAEQNIKKIWQNKKRNIIKRHFKLAYIYRKSNYNVKEKDLLITYFY